jgi:hypothetical protein
MEASTFFITAVVLILIYDAYLWFSGKETITQWTIKTTKEKEYGAILPFLWGALIGHLFL